MKQRLSLEDRAQAAFERGRAHPNAENPYGRRTSGMALHAAFARGQTAGGGDEVENLRVLTAQEIDDLGWAIQRFREHTQQTLLLRDMRRLDRLVALQEALERDGLIRVTA